MKLTSEQEAMLNGSRGEVMAKVVKTLVLYGKAFFMQKEWYRSPVNTAIRLSVSA